MSTGGFVRYPSHGFVTAVSGSAFGFSQLFTGGLIGGQKTLPPLTTLLVEPNQHILQRIDQRRAVPCLGDVNGDGLVDQADLSLIQTSFGGKTGEHRFDDRADVNNDGIISKVDLTIVQRELGCSTKP